MEKGAALGRGKRGATIGYEGCRVCKSWYGGGDAVGIGVVVK